MKEEKQRRKVIAYINRMFSNGSLVVVEGEHDINALKKLGEEIEGLNLSGAEIKTYQAFMNDGIGKQYARIYLFMDGDKNGEEKTLKAMAFAGEKEQDARVDTGTGEKLRKMLGIKCVEEIMGSPIIRSLERIRRD